MRVLPLGDRGLLIEVGGALLPEINAQARALAVRLGDLPGVEEAVPALRSVLVVFDPLTADPGLIAETAERVLPTLPPHNWGTGRLIEVPVVYGGEAGPDLEEVASLRGLSAEQAIRAHSEVEYTVYMLGFTPGYPYLGILPEELRVSRLPSPRLRVPEGSIAVADAMTGIYPLASPGGWRIIGRTPLAIYEPLDADPVVLRPGDRVRFTPASRAQFRERLGQVPLPFPRRAIFEVRSPGLYTTVQDAGRRGHRALGIPAAGAMDLPALWAANAAVGNAPDAAAIELTAPGPVLRVLDHLTIAIAGADLSPTLNGASIAPATPVLLRPGQTLQFGAPRAGMWAYLAVAGGVEARRVLGSASTYVPGLLGGSGGRRLREGDLLGSNEPPRQRRPNRASGSVENPPIPGPHVTVRVIPGPQDEWLTEEARSAFLKEEYRISLQGDRAGTRLDGPGLSHRTAGEFLSDGVLPGAVQVPSGGRPIVIMPDGPTTGGYPKVAVVISADLRLLAQARPGTAVRFRAVTMEEAVDALHRQQAMRTERLG